MDQQWENVQNLHVRSVTLIKRFKKKCFLYHIDVPGVQIIHPKFHNYVMRTEMKIYAFKDVYFLLPLGILEILKNIKFQSKVKFLYL